MTSPKGRKSARDWAIEIGTGAAAAFSTAIMAPKTGKKVLNKSQEKITKKEDIPKTEIYQRVPVEISVMQPVHVKVDFDVKAAALVGASVAGGILTAKVVGKLFCGGGGAGGSGSGGAA